MTSKEELTRLYTAALWEHNKRIRDYNKSNNENIPFKERFEHYIIEKKGTNYLLIPQGAYTTEDNKEAVAGLGLSIENNNFNLHGFSAEDINEVSIKKFKHPCNTGREYGIIGALYTLVNYFNMINKDTNNSTVFQVIPHLNTAIQEASGNRLKEFKEEQEARLELILGKSVEKINEFNTYIKGINRIKHEEEYENALMYKFALQMDFSSVLTNLAGLKEDISGINKPVLAYYLMNTFDKQYINNGYDNLRKIIRQNLQSIICKYPNKKMINQSLKKKIIKKLQINGKNKSMFKQIIKDYLINNETKKAVKLLKLFSKEERQEIMPKEVKVYEKALKNIDAKKHNRIKKLLEIMNNYEVEFPKNEELIENKIRKIMSNEKSEYTTNTLEYFLETLKKSDAPIPKDLGVYLSSNVYDLLSTLELFEKYDIPFSKDSKIYEKELKFLINQGSIYAIEKLLTKIKENEIKIEFNYESGIKEAIEQCIIKKLRWIDEKELDKLIKLSNLNNYNIKLPREMQKHRKLMELMKEYLKKNDFEKAIRLLSVTDNSLLEYELGRINELFNKGLEQKLLDFEYKQLKDLTSKVPHIYSGLKHKIHNLLDKQEMKKFEMPPKMYSALFLPVLAAGSFAVLLNNLSVNSPLYFFELVSYFIGMNTYSESLKKVYDMKKKNEIKKKNPGALENYKNLKKLEDSIKKPKAKRMRKYSYYDELFFQ